MDVVSFIKCVRIVAPYIKGNNNTSKYEWFRPKMKVQNKQWQIINGTLADIKDFPYMAIISYCDAKILKTFSCGGNIITDYHILSAAHCATAVKDNTTLKQFAKPLYQILKPENYLIEVGTSNMYLGGQFLQVSEVHVHPEYFLKGLFGRDLSVLKVAEKFSMSNTVATIPVATPELSYQLKAMENSHTECVTAGWGDTNKPIKFPIPLRSVKLPLMKIEDCIKLGRITDFHITREEHLCTYRRYKDVCHGDSGGGLLCKGQDGVQRIWGVVSFGKNCANFLRPSFYARVDNADLFLKQFLDTKSSSAQSAATLQKAVLELLFLLVLQVASFSFR